MSTPIEFCDLQALHQRHLDLRGKVVVAQHFATWCGGCVEELPLITALCSRLADDPEVVFVGVSWELFLGGGSHEETAAELQAFAQEHGIPFEILVYTGEPPALIDRFGITTGTIPHTIVYDASGAVAARFAEPFADEHDARRLLDAIERARVRR
jgi:thiol-disulfide isomerase/thioredoxin